MSTTIYSLGEPDSREIRYIGKTTRIKRRYHDHLTESPKKRTHLGNWLRCIVARGEKPVLTTLCEVPNEQGSQAEMLFIKLARDGGMKLVNSTDGGEGITMTTEIKEKIRAANLGENCYNFGQKASAETRAKMSAVRTGLPLSLSPAQREARSERQRGSKNHQFGKTPTEAEKQANSLGNKASWVVRLSTPEGRAAASNAAKVAPALRRAGLLPPLPPRSASVTRSDTLKVSWQLRKLPLFCDGGGI